MNECYDVHESLLEVEILKEEASMLNDEVTVYENAAGSNTDEAISPEQVKPALEALLFVASEPLPVDQLAKLLEIPRQTAQEALVELAVDYTGHGLLLRQVAGGWQFFTDSRFSSLVEKLYRPKYQQLSAAALETLAIIAYKQPVTRVEVSDIRQVDSDGVIATLMDKKLIMEVGRLAGAGRAILYGTSPEFLAFFGLNSLAELPEMAKNEAAIDEEKPLELPDIAEEKLLI